MKPLGLALFASVTAGFLLLPGGAGSVPGNLVAVTGSPTGNVKITPIGDPIWRPVGFRQFTAPIGTAESGYAEFLQTTLGILPPPNHCFCPELLVGPCTAHLGPYDDEQGQGIEDLGFAQGTVFSVSDFSEGQGIWCTWMTVPDPGETGSSPDFASGPIIPNSLFPINVSGQTFRNNMLWNPFLGTFDVPALTDEICATPDCSCTASLDVDGHSHIPIFFAESSDFGPGGNLLGSYEFRITMMDSERNGWDITARFQVVP